MKKNLFMVAAVAFMALVSCNKEEINNGGVERPQAQEPSVLVEFTASLGEEPAKTTLSEGKTLWLESDEISINGQVFKVKELVDGGASAIFVNKSEIPAGFAAPYTALYPANVTEIPSSQTAYAGTFDPAAVLETATSDDTHLSFKNVTSLLKFQVPARAEFTENITSVTITSTDVLAGSNAKEVTINCTEGFDPEETYYVAVLPGEKKNFEVSINGYISRTAPKVTIARSTITDMKCLPKPVIRVYITTERTHFDMNMYAWNVTGVTLPNAWPGEAMKWDDNIERYYYDFPYEIKGKQLKYIINNGVYQTEDLNATISAPTYNKAINWKWVYLLPSNNWKEGNAWFAAYFWKSNSNDNYWMKPIGPDKNGVYGYVKPVNLTSVTFVRMNPASTDMNWTNKWNETAGQTIPTDGKNYFQCTEGWWDSHNGGWQTYSQPLD